ncbi:MAG: helix-turn-helix transcriptional regulator [Eubacteriales bacterium]|nr:helix-turn-helix transcriptional regulator [Eubacteriales bacterium]
MKFSEKVRTLRKQFKFTQSELAERLGVSLRTVTNYETGNRYPQRREIYDRLGEVFEVNPDYFLTENDDEIRPRPVRKEPSKEAQMQHLIHHVRGLFAGGHLSDEDKDAVMQALQDAYWDAKRQRTE